MQVFARDNVAPMFDVPASAESASSLVWTVIQYTNSPQPNVNSFTAAFPTSENKIPLALADPETAGNVSAGTFPATHGGGDRAWGGSGHRAAL